MSQSTMNNGDCVDLIRNGVAAGMDDDELLGLFEQVKKTRQALEHKQGGVDNVERALQEAVAQTGDRLILEAAAKKRALALQATARLKAVDYVLSTFAGQEEKGLSTLLVGSNYAKDSTRLSVDAQQLSLGGHYVGGLLADITAIGDTHLELFRRGAMDNDVARALWALDNPEAKIFKGPKEAAEVAGIIHKWQEKARSDANLSGALIGKLPGYIVRQSHNRSKLRRAGFEAWHKFLTESGEDGTPLLDWEKIQDGTLVTNQQRRDFLYAAYNHIAVGRENPQAPNGLSGMKPSTVGNVATKMSHERVLHFADADAWAAYNAQFGVGNLREAVINGLMSSAQSTALMRTLGPSPQHNFNSIVNDIRSALYARADTDGVARLDNARRALSNQIKEVDGSLNFEGNASAAAIGRTIRMWQNMTKLGKVLMSSFADIPLFSGEFAYQGRSFFGSMLEGMGSMLKGRGTVEQQKILSQLGVFFDGMAADVTARFSGDELPGKMTRMQNIFFKLNGLQWWTDTWRKSAALMMSHDLALDRALDWPALSMQRKRLLSMYGIDAEKWEIIRSGETRAADGRNYLTPDAVNDVSDNVLADYLQRQGQDATPARLDNLRFDLQNQLRTMIRDRLDFAVLTPDGKTRSYVRQGTAAGTGVGEALRFVMQFKSFPLAFMQKTMGREFIGRANEGKGAAFLNFSRLFLMTTLFGYGSMTAKEWLAGKTPRIPEDAESFKKIAMAAAAQGGGLGIYGDFLFGEANRMGGGFGNTILGPTLGGTITDVENLYKRLRDGDSVAQTATRAAINATPGNNLWWFRTGFDYAIGYSLFESMKPGFYARTKRRVEKENNQTFWMRPIGVN